VRNRERERNRIELVDEAEDTVDVFGPFGGQIISTTKDLCKKAFLNAQPRLCEGMYKCSI